MNPIDRLDASRTAEGAVVARAPDRPRPATASSGRRVSVDASRARRSAVPIDRRSRARRDARTRRPTDRPTDRPTGRPSIALFTHTNANIEKIAIDP